jgi:ABC-2 type transport system permease protein
VSLERGGVNGALFELLWRSLRGSLVRRARRLRQPRYLITFLLSAGYFGFLVLPSLFNWARQARGPNAAGAGGMAAAGLGGPGGAARLLVMAAALAAAAGMTLMWALASSKPALRLGEADINLLLPAPVPRRKLIELALWKQQAGLLFGALVLTLFRGYGSPATRVTRLLTTWAVLTLIGLHSQGVSLWKARLRELPPPAARRRVGIAIAVAAAWWAAVVVTLWEALASPATAAAGAAGDGGGAVLGDAIRRLASSPPPQLWALLAPFRWVVRAFLGAGAPGGGGSSGLGSPGLGGAAFLALLVVAHYEWVVRSRARFEDAVLERARRQMDRRLRRPALPALTARARGREPFRLAPTGRPEVAIYWKNLLIPSRQPLARRLSLSALAAFAAYLVGTAIGAPLAYVAPVAGSGLMLMLLIPPFAGLNLRHDLRTDLLQLEILRPWPVPGWRLVAAELLAPATTAIGWTLTGFGLLMGAMLSAGGMLGEAGRLAPLARLTRTAAGPAGAGAAGVMGVVVALGLALLIAGVPVTLLSSALQNVAALMLPGWMTLGPERRAGSGLAGQRLLLMVGQFLAVAAGLLPALLLAGAALLAGSWLGMRPAPWQAPLLALLGALPVLAEVGLLVRAGGAFWDRLDPSQELLQPED